MGTNVLVLVVDCLRADYVDVNGRRAKGLTPFVEEFSKKGVVFEETITQSSWTKTSVASILTGTYPFTHNVHYILDKIPAELPTIAEAYRNGGYRTGYFTSNPYLKVGTGYEKGFETRKIIDKDYGELLNDELFRAIDADSDPFFYYVQYMDAHQPYRIHHARDEARQREVMEKFDTGLRSSREISISEEELSILRDMYSQEVRYVDTLLNQVVDYLQKRGRLAGTLVVITADHGIELWEHGGLYHSAKLYNELIRVPFIMVGPEFEGGRFIKGRVRSVDIMPTLLSYSNLASPDTVQGMSLIDCLKNPEIDSLSLLAYSERDRTHEQLKLRCLVRDSWKLITYEKQEGQLKKGVSTFFSLIKNLEVSMIQGAFRAGKNYVKRKLRRTFRKGDKAAPQEYFELFDLSEDPWERNNIAPQKGEMRDRMHQSLKEFMEGKGEFRSEEKIEMEKDLAERLKALGYID